MGCLLACLVSSEVGGHVGDKGSGDGGLDDGRAVNADEPEQAHGAVDDGEAYVAIGCGEQGLEDLDDALGEAEAKRAAEDKVEEPEDGNGDGEGDEVLERLGDVGRNLVGQLDGDVARHEELVDNAYHKCRDKGGKQAL